jgi:transcriptional regulator with XRE-family HTH domain
VDTIGKHLKARRLALHFFQSRVASEIGVDRASIQNWERGIYRPIPRYYPAIIKFLGYIPFNHDGSLGSQTRWLRLCVGWTQEELGNAAGCEESTILRWETNQPFEKGRWNQGVAAMIQRLETLGLSELTSGEVAGLLNGSP